MTYNFDKTIDRAGTGAVKLDLMPKLFGRSDLLPLWVADMDFETPTFIVDALKARMEHPVFGYTLEPADYWPVVQRWIRDHHQWDVRTEWLSYVPGVVRGIGFAINALTAPGDRVIIQTPVYHPFRTTIEGNRRIFTEADDVIFVPETDALLLPVPEIVPLQLFAYYVAKENGCDIDKPKNLAKSVTVE